MNISLSLRAKLMLLIVLAFLPVVALEVNTALERQEHAAEEVEAETIRLAGLVASNQRTTIETSRQLLITLAQVDSVRRGTGTPSESLLRRLLKLNPLYANLGACDAAGNVYCSALKMPGPVNLSNSPFFQQAMQTRDFAIGEFEHDRITGRPVLSTAYPVMDDGERVVGVVFVELDLYAMSRFGASGMLPPGGTMAMVSDRNIFLLCYPDPQQWIGKAVSEMHPLFPLGVTATTFEAPGVDKIKRLFAVQRLLISGPTNLYIRVGVSVETAFSVFYHRLLIQVGVVAGIALAALAGAWVMGSFFIVQPARHLVSVARAVSAGDFAVRSNVRADAGEFGEIGYAVNQMADALSRRIEEINQAQQETLLLRNRAMAALNSGVIVTDPTLPDNPVVDANPAFERITGYEKEQIVGRNCRILQGPETDPEAVAVMRQAIAEARDCQVTLRNYRKDGTPFWNEVKIAPVLDASGRLTHFVGVLTDVSERVRAQESLERAAEELRRSNDELEQFAYVASHDLQEPLRMVASYTQLLARRYKDQLDQNAQEFIGFAVDGAQRMQGFIHDLLQYSRVGTHGHPFERLSVERILHRALDNLRFAIDEKHAEVTVGPMPEVEADPVQLTQLFQNLISNALKFSAERPLRIEIRATRHDAEWEFAVQDNGIGIELQDCERIFVIFQRLHSRQEYEGTGLGLAIAKKIVERHRGRIWVHSQRGEGTTFFFTLREKQA